MARERLIGLTSFNKQRAVKMLSQQQVRRRMLLHVYLKQAGTPNGQKREGECSKRGGSKTRRVSLLTVEVPLPCLWKALGG